MKQDAAVAITASTASTVISAQHQLIVKTQSHFFAAPIVLAVANVVFVLAAQNAKTAAIAPYS